MRISSENPISQRNKLPNWSQEAETSPIEGGRAETLLFCQVTPPFVLYLAAVLQVSSANKLLVLSGLIAIVCSALLAADLVMLRLGPTVRVAAPRTEHAKKPTQAITNAQTSCARRAPRCFR